MTFIINNKTYIYEEFESDFDIVTSNTFQLAKFLSKKFLNLLNNNEFSTKYKNEERYFIKYLLETINYFCSCITLLRFNAIAQVFTLCRTTFEYYTVSTILLTEEKLIKPFYSSRVKIAEYLNKSKEDRAAFRKSVNYNEKRPYQEFLETEWIKDILPEISKPKIKDLQKYLKLEGIISLNEFLNANVHGTINLFNYKPIDLDVGFAFDLVYLVCGLFGKLILQICQRKNEFFESFSSLYDIFYRSFDSFMDKYASVSFLQFDIAKK